MIRRPFFAFTAAILLAAAHPIAGTPTRTSPEPETPCVAETGESGPCDIEPCEPCEVQLGEGEPAPSPTSPELAVEREIVERGHYRLRGTGSAPTSVDRALQILTDFDQHCAEGCRWPVSTLDHVETLDAEALELDTSNGERFTWTDIDDLMDASYFQRSRYRELDGGVELTIEIPERETVEKLTSEARDHRPFFHAQRVTWRLSPSAQDGVDVVVEMEMLSDSFLINLAPNRVLDGAELTLQEYFGHLLADAAARTR